MLALRVVAEKRSWIRHHIHLEATLVPRGPLLEGESALDRVDNITSMEGLDQKSPENRLESGTGRGYDDCPRDTTDTETWRREQTRPGV